MLLRSAYLLVVPQNVRFWLMRCLELLKKMSLSRFCTRISYPFYYLPLPLGEFPLPYQGNLYKWLNFLCWLRYIHFLLNEGCLTWQAMMKDQFANYVVQKVLETCDDQQRELILSRIKVHLNALKKYTYGKHIVARVEKLVAAGGKFYCLFKYFNYLVNYDS